VIPVIVAMKNLRNPIVHGAGIRQNHVVVIRDCHRLIKIKERIRFGYDERL